MSNWVHYKDNDLSSYLDEHKLYVNLDNGEKRLVRLHNGEVFYWDELKERWQAVEPIEKGSIDEDTKSAQ